MNDSATLLNQLKDLCIDVTEETYSHCIQKGYAILVMLHDLEVTQEQVYEPLLQYHNNLEDGLSRDIIADIMDFVVGWCAPQRHIWRCDGEFDLTL